MGTTVSICFRHRKGLHSSSSYRKVDLKSDEEKGQLVSRKANRWFSNSSGPSTHRNIPMLRSAQGIDTIPKGTPTKSSTVSICLGWVGGLHPSITYPKSHTTASVFVVRPSLYIAFCEPPERHGEACESRHQQKEDQEEDQVRSHGCNQEYEAQDTHVNQEEPEGSQELGIQ